MEALAASGNRAEALRVARVHARLMEEELGAAPGAEVTELADALREESAEGPRAATDRRASAAGEGSGEEERGEERAEEAPGRAGPPARESEPAAAAPAGDPRRGPSALARGRRLAVTALVGLGLLAGAVVAGWHLIGSGGDVPASSRPSIAVLPFRSEGGAAAAFTEGMYADVVSRLSGVPGLDVVSGAAAEGFAASEDSLPRLADRLGAAWALEGEIQASGDRVRMIARLVDAAEGRELWSEEYRRELTARDAFELQEELTREIVGELESRLQVGETDPVERSPPENLEAYRFYAQGRGLLKQRTGPEMRQAVDHFRRAIRADSGYAMAWAGLADALALLEGAAGLGESRERGDGGSSGAISEATGAARRALALNPRLAEAHASLGLLHAYRSAGPEAVRELRQAVRLRSGYAEAHHRLALVWLSLGDPGRSRRRIDRAVQLDPLSPGARASRATALLIEGNEEEALAEARRAREIQPMYTGARIAEAMVLYHLGRLEEARSVLASLSGPAAEALGALSWTAGGEEDRAREILDRLEDSGDHPFHAALVLAALGEADAAFARLGRVERWSDLFALPAFRYLFPEVLGELRQDPRYAAILRELNRHWGLEADGRFPGDRGS
jgi:TolB-like protein